MKPSLHASDVLTERPGSKDPKPISVRRFGEHRWIRNVKPYLFIAPVTVLALLFSYFPFLRTVLYSVSRVNYKGEILDIIGLEHFRGLFTNRLFHQALRTTLRFTLLFVPLNLTLALFLALLCTEKRRLSGLYEGMIIAPMAVSMSAIAMILKLMLNPTTGIVNYMLGIDWGWFSDRHFALYGILILTLWLGIPFAFLVLLAALRNVPPSLMEAASIDGAGPIMRFVAVRLPMITPSILFIVCMNTIQAMLLAGPVMILTEGGPQRSTTTLIYMMYTSGYQSSNYSLSAAVSLVVFLLTLTVTIFLFRLEGRGVHYH